MPPRIWNTRRQVLGNLIPLFFGIVVALALYRLGIVPRALCAIVAASLGVNLWGFFENSKIERELRALTRSAGELIGFVYKVPPTLFDAHAEIGIMTVEPDRLEVMTERGGLTIRQVDIVGIRRRRNIHSILFLGGWIVIELRNGQEFRFESRRHWTMLGSKSRSNQLYLELTLWNSEKSPA